MTTPPHFRDENVWERPDESEIERLQQTLYPHLRKIKVSYTKPKRLVFVRDLLEKQKYTCAFGVSVDGKHCWNEPKDSSKKYLKLQWGHIKPRCRDDETQTIDDLCLLCARCNNQIQTSRYLCQLKAELESKIENIDELIRDGRKNKAPVIIANFNKEHTNNMRTKTHRKNRNSRKTRRIQLK
jgi:hypothetical protein